MVAEFRRRRDVIVAGLNGIPGISCLEPQGAFYVFQNITGTGLTSAGLSGLGVPYVLAIGLWVLAVLSAVTFGQRVLAVHAATRPGQAVVTAPGTAEEGTAEQGGTSPPPAGGTL